MSPRRKGVPRLRRHKTHRCGVVRLDGRDYYLGAWPSTDEAAPPEVQAAYDRKIAEWMAGGRRLPGAGPALTVNQLAARFLAHAKAYYVDEDGKPTTEYGLVKRSVGHLCALYGTTKAAEFGPLALKAVRDRMVVKELGRKTINAYTDRIRRCFRWAVEQELVPPSVYHGLKAVKGLARGRTAAPEYEDVPPAPETSVEAVLRTIAEPWCSMIQVQRFSGMRPGEVCRLRVEEIDKSAEPWTWRPKRHKTRHKGKARVIFFGPRSRGALVSILGDRTDGPAFGKVSPTEYARQVRLACEKAGVERWSPNQLRHTAGTEARRAGGIEAAQAILGHANVSTSELYALKNEDLAKRVIEEIG